MLFQVISHHVKHALSRASGQLCGFEHLCIDRSVVAAAGTGSLTGLLLNLVAQALAAPLPAGPLLDCPVCLDIQVSEIVFRSLGLGLLIEVALGPLIDFQYGIRVLWRSDVSRWWGTIARSYPYPLYRVHE